LQWAGWDLHPALNDDVSYSSFFVMCSTDSDQFLIESYYRTTAETFNFSMGRSPQTPGNRKLMKEQETAALNALKKLGFELEFDELKVSQLVDLKTEIDKCCSSAKLEDDISNQDDLDFPARLVVREYADVLLMSDDEFTKQQELRKRLRDLLWSLVKK
jgi:phenylalanyl-tRNA synthetase alpha subunit